MPGKCEVSFGVVVSQLSLLRISAGSLEPVPHSWSLLEIPCYTEYVLLEMGALRSWFSIFLRNGTIYAQYHSVCV